MMALPRCINVMRHSTVSLSAFSRVRSLSFVTPVDDFEVTNEPTLDYLKGSNERKTLEDALEKYKNTCTDVPIVIGNEEFRTDNVKYQAMPFDHSKKIAKYYGATSDIVQKAIDSSIEARKEWEARPISERISILLKAADLVSGKYRMDLNATTMLGQGKTVIQAEIDAAAELADFFRFNAYFAKELTKYQPLSPSPTISKNTFRHRGIEGFVVAVSPFNFTAIGGNLSTNPTLMGNVVVWKPSSTSVLSNYITYQLLREAGFPPGVINFVTANGPIFGDTICSSPQLAGINFTGSVGTFQHLWKQTAQNLEKYHNFPRFIGECGGKNSHFIHPSAHIQSVVNGTIRSAFEFGGQKCSACSRMYVPESIWPQIKEGLLETRKKLKLGSPLEYDSFLSAVIDEKAFNRIKSYIDYAKSSSNMEILDGGNCDSRTGYYVEPTVVITKDPEDRIMKEEIFGPVLTVFVYPDKKIEEALRLTCETAPFGLAGSIFASDEKFISEATELLKMSAGNFYINDKSTGSVVGQQPFGGGRISGTNDKAGGPHCLLRWTSPQVVKETFKPLTEWDYPYMRN
ncbi:delta-1-pyrroline-5-carboxylate dehydrogenase, mitochondrial-like [Tachypleus tridentatus]|uniref:delta-1-pyrroline-5-carboxylate dehydrogenase, mitochondrial-like n=1 Tax=Tachypleus tridentatus TaxID=6853 RepID=UPI003FD2E09E